MLTFAWPKLRLDANLEVDYLRLGRDKLNGEGKERYRLVGTLSILF
jgi:hypothetical protein